MKNPSHPKYSVFIMKAKNVNYDVRMIDAWSLSTMHCLSYTYLLGLNLLGWNSRSGDDVTQNMVEWMKGWELQWFLDKSRVDEEHPLQKAMKSNDLARRKSLVGIHRTHKSDEKNVLKILEESLNTEPSLPAEPEPEPEPEPVEADICPICLEPMYLDAGGLYRKYLYKPCNHAVHSVCLTENAQHRLTCPLCRGRPCGVERADGMPINLPQQRAQTTNHPMSSGAWLHGSSAYPP